MVCGGPVNRRLGNVDSGLNNKRHYPRATHNSAPTADERSRELREREKERERESWMVCAVRSTKREQCRNKEVERDSGGLPFNYRAGLASPAAMLHDPTMSSFGVYSGHPFGTFGGRLSSGLSQDYCICIICDCVPRNFWPTYEDSVRRSLLPARASLAGQRSSSVFRELYQSHFAPGSCSLVGSSRFRANATRYRLSTSTFPRNLSFFRPLFVLHPPPPSPLPFLRFFSLSLSRVLLLLYVRFDTLLRFDERGMKKKKKKNERRARPSCRPIVRPLSTQPRQIRFGVVFSATTIGS